MSLWSYISTQRSFFLNLSGPAGLVAGEDTGYAPAENSGVLGIPSLDQIEYWENFHYDVNGLAALGSLEKLTAGVCACW